MPYSHILITRPQQEASELAEMLAPSGAKSIIMPAYDFYASELFSDQISHLQRAAAGPTKPLLIFTSPRSVEHGLGQIPPDVLTRVQIAAIGASTAALLEEAGAKVVLRPDSGYTSEDLLASLASQPGNRDSAARPAFILAAPGGRTALSEGLQAQGFEPHMLMVYGRRAKKIAPDAITAIERAETLLSVWTSANTMSALSQRLPPACWSHLCRADWMVISDRLRRLARAFSPAHIYLAEGPANSDIYEAIQRLP
jgi:uroporphyrinogen-III synthase